MHTNPLPTTIGRCPPPRVKDRAGDPASQQGNKLITDICQQGHCPWCCHKAGGSTGASQPQIPVSQSHGQRAPSPAPPSSQPFRPPPGEGGLQGGALAQTLLPADSAQPEKRPAQPKVGERQNCFLNWYFPVDRTFYAFFHLYHLITKCFHF